MKLLVFSAYILSIDTRFYISKQERVLFFIVRYVNESNGMLYERFLAMCCTASTISDTALFNVFNKVFNKSNFN